MYCLFVKLDENNIYTSEWIRFIRNTLNECGLSYIWSQQDSINPEWLKKKDADIHQSPKCLFYKTIKESITLEKYLLFLPFKYRKALAKFRMSNHNLTIETGRHRGIPREKRICPICNLNSVGDELHYITQCPYF